MSEFHSHDGLRLHYEIQGEGPPVVLLHSFGFDGRLWDGPGVVTALRLDDRSVITLDARGHGRSDHPHDGVAYGVDHLASDVTALLDHLRVAATDLASYSMGSFVALRVLQVEHRVRRAVLGGVGRAALEPVPPLDDLLPRGVGPDDAAAVLTRSAPHLRRRVEEGEADPQALIEVFRAGFVPEDKTFATVTAEVLLLCGTEDDNPEPLAEAIPGSTIHRVDADHDTTMEHPEFTPTIVAFLSGGELPPSFP